MLDQLTTEEKAALTGGASMWRLPGVPRLGLRALKMSDGPSGVRGSGFTARSLVLPCGTALGATWNPDLLVQVGRVLGEEAKDKDVDLLLGPTVNIVRTPLAGRTFECFSEDPALSSALAVAYIEGVQARGVGCCIKHFACNDQETERMTISAEVDERTLRELHLPVFEAAVAAGVWAVMSAYNRVNGVYCSEHEQLLHHILKDEWGFDGVVVSDWFGTHSTAPAALAGLDVEMPGPATWLGPALARAVADEAVPLSALDAMAGRVLRLMERTGALEPARADQPELDNDVAERRLVARRAAAESMVLLTNNGVLPLQPANVAKVALIGPNALRLEVGGGGSATVNPHPVVTLLDALRSRLGDGVSVVHQPGCSISAACPSIDPRLLDGGGVSVEFWDNVDFDGAPAATERAAGARLMWMGPPAPQVTTGHFSARGTTVFTPDRDGLWRLSLESAGRARLWMDGTILIDNWAPSPGSTFMGMGSVPVEVATQLQAGRAYELGVELRINNGAPLAGVRIGAEPLLGAQALPDALDAAREADVAVVVVGTTPDQESEGFDRTSLALPGAQDDLVAQVLAVNPNTVVVLNAGAPLALPWVDSGGPAALLVAWFPGQEGGEALADVLVGQAEPGGRLPVTFPRRIEDTPVLGVRRYPGQDGQVFYEEGTDVGYRHYRSPGPAPLFAFGHGLSYTSFDYGAIVDTTVAGSGDVEVSFSLTNVGQRRGSEVVQCYVAPGDGSSGSGPPAPTLGAFQKVELDPGEVRQLRLRLGWRAFARWDPTQAGWVVDPGPWELRLARSSSEPVQRRVVVLPGRSG